MDAENYGGTLLSGNDGKFSYALNASTQYPELTINGKTFRSQNRLLTSDDWANGSTGTSGDNHPTKLKTWVLTMTYDGQTLTTYRNGLVDQVIAIEGLDVGHISVRGDGFKQQCLAVSTYILAATPLEVQQIVAKTKAAMKAEQNANLPTSLTNGDFESSYAPLQGSGVSSDRAIYVPQGWTIDYTARNENDLTALKSGDLYFDRFFGAYPSPSADSRQTYWVRQNWGGSTITLKQEMLLPAGRYTLTADVWKSGLGGDANLQAVTQDGATAQAPTVENKEEWQQMSVGFESDGVASTTIALVAMHNNNGTEKIIGFDNVRLLLAGDVNGDGSINVVDLTMIIDYVQGREVDGFITGTGDVNGDGTIDNSDIVSLLDKLL